MQVEFSIFCDDDDVKQQVEFTRQARKQSQRFGGALMIDLIAKCVKAEGTKQVLINGQTVSFLLSCK
jgi:hypothetical protein